jgi:hypothetical protein
MGPDGVQEGAAGERAAGRVFFLVKDCLPLRPVHADGVTPVPV